MKSIWGNRNYSKLVYAAGAAVCVFLLLPSVLPAQQAAAKTAPAAIL